MGGGVKSYFLTALTDISYENHIDQILIITNRLSNNLPKMFSSVLIIFLRWEVREDNIVFTDIYFFKYLYFFL